MSLAESLDPLGDVVLVACALGPVAIAPIRSRGTSAPSNSVIHVRRVEWKSKGHLP
jgi:hypothetical protein